MITCSSCLDLIHPDSLVSQVNPQVVQRSRLEPLQLVERLRAVYFFRVLPVAFAWTEHSTIEIKTKGTEKIEALTN